MLALCTIIGLLCVPKQYVPFTHYLGALVEVDRQGNALPRTFDPAESKRLGIEIAYFSGSAFEVVSPLGIDKACSGAWCLYYRKHCEKTVCRYRIAVSHKQDARPGLVFAFAPDVEIHAPTSRVLHRIIDATGFVIGSYGSEKPFIFPLASLSHESPALDAMRACMRSIWVQGCPQPDRPQLRDEEHP